MKLASLPAVVLAVTLSGNASAASLPVLPTELTGRQALEVRPPVIDFTGDGSGFLGGRTRRASISKPRLKTLRDFGRLHWSSWTGADARATGAVWLDNGIPDEASGTFYRYNVEVRAFRPRHGIFTRLAFAYWTGNVPHATVRSAHFFRATQYGPGYWQWF
ncbi:MAG: hypothetical protein ACYCXW_10740 [Solirubrobacteraceae bacterium]